MFHVFSDLEGIRIAIEMERRGESFYRRAAKVSKSEDTVQMLLSLAADEMHHKAEFERLYKAESEAGMSDKAYDDETNAYLTGRIRQIAEGIAAAQNGRAEFTEMKFLPYVVNDATVTERMALSAEALLGKDKVLHKKRTMGGEDFSYLCRQKPGMMFRLGICGGPETGYALHTDTFDVDERCFGVGIDLFVRFVLDNMQGIFWPEKQ